MVKKKQVRFSVSIPYDLRENKLTIQPINWPAQCPCCSEKEGTALGILKFQHSVNNAQISTLSPSTRFPLEWEVPYCLKCQKHMKDVENWPALIVVVSIFLPLILALILDLFSSMLSFVLMWSLFIAGGLVLRKILIQTVIVKPPCLRHDLAVRASSLPVDEHRIIFNFDSEEYAQIFAALNLAESENHVK